MQHLTLRDIKQHEKLLKISMGHVKQIIAFVRNPYDRVVSGMLYAHKDSNFPRKTALDPKYLTNADVVLRCLKEYLSVHPQKLFNHNLPQLNFVCDEEHRLCSDVIIMKNRKPI